MPYWLVVLNCFEHVLFSNIFGIIIPIDQYFSNGVGIHQPAWFWHVFTISFPAASLPGFMPRLFRFIAWSTGAHPKPWLIGLCFGAPWHTKQSHAATMSCYVLFFILVWWFLMITCKGGLTADLSHVMNMFTRDITGHSCRLETDLDSSKRDWNIIIIVSNNTLLKLFLFDAVPYLIQSLLLTDSKDPPPVSFEKKKRWFPIKLPETQSTSASSAIYILLPSAGNYSILSAARSNF